MNDWTATVERYLAEGRTVSGGKGSDVAQTQMNSYGHRTLHKTIAPLWLDYYPNAQPSQRLPTAARTSPDDTGDG